METILSTFQSDYYSPSCQSHEGILDLHCENLVGFLEVKPTEMWGLPNTAASIVLILIVVHTQPPGIHKN